MKEKTSNPDPSNIFGDYGEKQFVKHADARPESDADPSPKPGPAANTLGPHQATIIIRGLQKQLQEKKTALSAALAQLRARAEEAIRTEPQRTESGLSNTTFKRNEAEVSPQVWPNALLTEQWEPWRRRLLGRAQTESASALLLATLHMFRAADQSGREDLLCDALRQIGLFVFLSDATSAAALAAAFNATAQGRFRLLVPTMSEPVANAWMNCKPNTTSVTEVLGWAVFDAEGRVRHRANVT